MTEKKTKRQEQLDKVVESKIKGMGLDALFHLVDVNKDTQGLSSSSGTSQNQDNKPFLQKLKNGLHFLRPRNIKYHLQNIYSAKPNLIIGLSIDSNGIKIIELKETKGAAHLNNVQYIPIPRAFANSKEKSDGFITETLTQILDPHTTKNAYICSIIPRSKVIIKFFSLPTTDPTEIEDMVELEAEHHVPFALNECIFDYDVLYYEDGQAHLVFVTIKKDEIAKHLQLLDKVNLQPCTVDISSLVLHNTLAWEKSQEGRTVQIYIGPDHTDINVSEDGNLKTSRGIPWGSKSLTIGLSKTLNVNLEIAEKMQNENGIVIKKSLKNDVTDSISKYTCEWAQKLIAEIKETIRHFQFQEGLNKIDRIILTGDGSRLLNLDEYLKDQLNTQVFKQEPPEIFEQNNNESFHRSFNELSILTGLAGKFDETRSTGVNLLPHNLKYTYERKKQSARQLTTLSIAVLAVLVVLVIPVGANSFRNQYIHELDNKIAKLEPQATQIRALSDKVQTIEDYRSISRSCIEILREISLLVSLDISIDKFAFEQNDYVILLGEAESHASVVNLSRAVRESKLFENAVLKYTRKKNRSEGTVNFEIVCKISK